jgi:uncharacterized membrane protein required for colicin V production
MNWSDMAVIAVISVFGIIGLVNGFVFSIFRLASFFASVIISIKFYPRVAEILMKTGLYTSIKGSVSKSLMLQQSVFIPQTDTQAGQAAAEQVVGRLGLPGFFKDLLIDRIPNPSSLVDISRVMDTVSDEFTRIIISVISVVLLYIAARIALVFLRFILQGIAKLPVFKQMDKLGGFALGAVEGLMTIYIICAVLMLFSTAPQFKQVFESIESSAVARFFYQNNFIVLWMF